MEPEADYILVIDADMIFRSPFIPEQMDLAPGMSSNFHAPVQISIQTAYINTA